MEEFTLLVLGVGEMRGRGVQAHGSFWRLAACRHASSKHAASTKRGDHGQSITVRSNVPRQLSGPTQTYHRRHHRQHRQLPRELRLQHITRPTSGDERPTPPPPASDPLTPQATGTRLSTSTMSRRFVPRLSNLSAASTKPTAITASRPFTSASAAWSKAPALADIEPDTSHVFDKKQKHFRDNLAEAHRKRKESERASSQSAMSSSSSSSSASSSDAKLSHSVSNDAAHGISENASHFLGSLSSVAGEAARKAEAASGDKKKGTGLLSRVIHGTEEGREMDREIERSFSQVLARGKYVHSIVFHEVKPDKVEEYVKLVGGWYPKVAKDGDNHVNLVGSWRTEVGECDTFGEEQCERRWEWSGLTRHSSHLGVPAVCGLSQIVAPHPELT